MRAYLTPRSVDDISHHLPIFRLGKRVPYIQFLRLLGRLTATSAVVPLGLLSLRPMEGQGLSSDGCAHGRHPIPPGDCHCGCVSLGVGCGVAGQGRTVQGQWSFQEGARHINVLELRAVLLALMHFLPQLVGRHVLVRSDNMSAVAQINHQGGTRSAPLLRVSQSLLPWALPRLASLRAVFLP